MGHGTPRGSSPARSVIRDNRIGASMNRDVAGKVASEDVIVACLRVIFRKVLEMQDRFDIDAGSITINTDLLSLPIDSLSLMYVINGIEERFDVYVPDEHVRRFTTVRSIVEYVQESLPAEAGLGQAARP